MSTQEAGAAHTMLAREVRAGVHVEQLTLGWMLVEAAVAIGAGVLARSVLLTAFGLDSVLELVTGGVLLRRLLTQARGGSQARVERAEQRAAWVTGIGLVLLCVYVLASATASVLTQTHAEASPVGIGLAVAALLAMPILAWRKRAIAARIGSAALRGDAACSITCAYMAGALLVGLLLNALFGWWWADSVAAVVFLAWLVPEAREALEGARVGRGACACGDDGCED
jgi:divalent metal cation (Fe/Co/Zn/Cd) transporter